MRHCSSRAPFGAVLSTGLAACTGPVVSAHAQAHAHSELTPGPSSGASARPLLNSVPMASGSCKALLGLLLASVNLIMGARAQASRRRARRS